MQSMFRLPWSTENPVMDKAQFSKQRPVVDIPLLSKLKRKRTNSPEPSPGSPFAKKWKYSEVRPVVAIGRPDFPLVDAPTTSPTPAHLVAPSVPPHVKTTNGSDALLRSPELESDAAAHTDPEPDSRAPQQPSIENTPPCDMADPTTYSPLQQIIETHFDHEILLKHNELRLIDQELAKCQIALEQIRRCRLIPYPGTDAPSAQLSQAVVVGPALEPRQGFTAPEQPAPWGVADGPYTRHYAKWLIPDPKFDSVPAASLTAGSRTGAAVAEGRATRASQAELPPATKSRSSRASAGSKLQALGDPCAPPRIDPLLHRRSTDGKWVRLFCHHPDCRHSNFSNTQGFLNHCRIKHNQKFESHDQAAVECGVLVDVNELGVVVPNESTPQTPAAASHTNGPLVHPLIKSTPPKSKPLPPRPLKKEHTTTTTPNPVRNDSSFVPSPKTPNLSALLQKSGASVDLNQLVDFARTKVELPDDTEDDDDETEPALSVQNTPKPTQKGDAQLQRGLPLSRQPARRAMAPASLAPNRNPVPPAGTLRGGSNSSIMHRSSNTTSTSSSSASSERGGALESPTMEMSPHTLDSAPGLVTDHEDDDDEEEEEEEEEDDDNGSVAMRDVTDFGVDDVVVEDASDVERDARRKSSVDGDALCDAKGAGVGGSNK